MLRLLTTFDRLIVRRLLTTYLVLIGALIVFYVVLDYVEYVDDFIDRGATMSEVFLVYYPNYVPEIVRLISPLALFLAAIFLTGRLAQKMELAALQTSGVSLYRLMVPYVLVGLVVTGFMFWFNGWAVPESNRVRIRFARQYVKDRPAVNEYNNIHRQNSPGSALSVDFFDHETLTAHGVTLQQFTDGASLTERIDARSLQWIDTLGAWRMNAAVIRRFDPDGRERLTMVESRDTVLALLPRNMARTDGDVESMTITEARDYLEVLERAGVDDLGIPRVIYHGKYAYPFANLILVLLAVPMASVRRRKGQAMILGIGLLVAFLYLAAIKLLEPFGYSGQLTPQLTAWLPHAGFLALALASLIRTRK